MLAADIYEKWVATSDVLSLAELALRWRYHAIFKIPYQLHPTGDSPFALYSWKSEASTAKGQKFHNIMPVYAQTKLEVLLQQIPSLLVLREDVENRERENPEYLASRPLMEREHPLLLAAQDNLHELLPCILLAWHKHAARKKEFLREIREFNQSGPSPFITNMLSCPEELLRMVPEQLFPNFRLDFEARTAFTTVELAQQFLKLCSIKKESDRLLALIEVDKRFPGLSGKEIAQLFPPPSGTQEAESLEKRAYRLRKEAYKYANIVFDAPVH